MCKIIKAATKTPGETMGSTPNILVMMTGGTIAQAVDADGRMQIARSVEDLVGQVRRPERIETHSFGARTGANLTFETVHAVAEKVIATQGLYDGYVLITGTDSMEEMAYLLDLVLDVPTPLVLTGAMKPSDIIGYDGIANLDQAIQAAAAVDSAGRGVLLAMNDRVHVARYVRKVDTQLIGAFQSHPGPVGEFRRGRLIYAFQNTRSADYFDHGLLLRAPRDIRVIVFTMDQPFSEALFSGADGAVIAGMGTASISEQWVEALSPAITRKMPIVLVSRCVWGTNFDDHYYRGSLVKYEDKGFLLADYADLNQMQARLRLALVLAAQTTH
jgi:L-asparaginase